MLETACSSTCRKQQGNQIQLLIHLVTFVILIKSLIVKKYISRQMFFTSNMNQDCSICQAPPSKQVRCKTLCHQAFCLKCAAKIKVEEDQCPHCYSTPFTVEMLPVLIRCPFSPQNCKTFIKTPEELKVHHLTCQFISPEDKKKIKDQANYKCKKGHKLSFLNKEDLIQLHGKYFFSSAKKECVGCNKISLCRSMCIPCSTQEKQEIYCGECRDFPCSKQKCPLGHPLKSKSVSILERYCDICEILVDLVGKQYYRCHQCDFDLCQECFSGMPQRRRSFIKKIDPTKLEMFAAENMEDPKDSDWVQK